MLTAKFDPQSFFGQTENLALHVPAAEVFSLLKRSLNLPPQWGALVRRGSGDQILVRAGGTIEADEAEDLLFIRLSPCELKLQLENLASQDGFSFEAAIRLRIQPVADRAELAGFLHEVVGSRRVVQAEGLGAFVRPVVHGALATFVSERQAAALTDADALRGASDSIAAALQVPMFKAGLSLESAPSVSLESAMFQRVLKTRENAAARQAQHEISRQMNDALHVARAQHLDRLTESLARLKELAAASPGTEVPELIRTFSDQQRGQLYEALFAAETTAAVTQWIVVACGDELLFFEAASPAQPARRLRVDGVAGPVRSLRLDGDGTLLVGASKGVYVWPLDRVSPEKTFVVPSAGAIRGGFNSAARAGGVLAATHSELGICEWNWNNASPRKARFTDRTRGAKAIRDITVFDGNIYCSIDDRIVRWRADSDVDDPDAEFRGASAIISALEPEVSGIYAGTSAGDLLYWPADCTDDPEVLHRGVNRAVESVWMQRTHGVRRIVFTDTSSRVHARVVGDSFTFHYEAGGQTLRRVDVAPDLLVATNELRDRLICWSPSRPEQPSHIIPVGKLSGRNVQDVCLVPFDAGKVV